MVSGCFRELKAHFYFAASVNVLCQRHIEPRHEKTFLCYRRTTKAQVSTFVVQCLDSIIPLLVIAEILRPKLVFVAEQTGLILFWSQTQKTGFLMTRLILRQDIPPCHTICRRIDQSLFYFVNLCACSATASASFKDYSVAGVKLTSLTTLSRATRHG